MFFCNYSSNATVMPPPLPQVAATAYQQPPYGGMVTNPANTAFNPAMNMPPPPSTVPPSYQFLTSGSGTGVVNESYDRQPPHNPYLPIK